jgi:pimeloyl-ACP methyl ester carboxylesterase
MRPAPGAADMSTTHEVETEHGRLSVMQSPGAGTPVLFIHGNSACKEMFERQFAAPMAHRWRFIAFDLPGHGASEDARDPERTYSIHGLADAAIALLQAMVIERAVVVGWSLGGHAALEVLARWPGAIAAWITGTPPVSADPRDMAAAFLPNPTMALTFKGEFAEAEAVAYAQEGVGPNVQAEPWMVEAARRADGRFRPMMLASATAGLDMDEKAIVAAAPQPLAVVTGAREPFVNNAYLAGLPYRNLWGGQVHVLEGLGHMPLWEAPQTVNPLLERFLTDVTR